jgi:hypothetical protein
MKSNPYKSIFISFFVALILFAIHKFAFILFAPEKFESSFVYSIELLYAFFFIFTVIILFVLIKINQKNINNVGFSFMFLTSLKMAIAYFFLRPILNSQSIYAGSEKINFFIIFILFLIIETVVTIRILNNKQ